MFGLAGLAAKLLLGIPGIVNGLFAYLDKKTDASVSINQANVSGDVAVNQAALTAFVEERKVVAGVRAADQQSRWTCWMLPTAFALCMVHFGAILLDSTFLFGWEVAKLPTPYDNMEWQIVATAVGFSGVNTIVRRIFKK